MTVVPSWFRSSVRHAHAIAQHAVPLAATGTMNCVAHASVLVHSWLALSIRHVPPIGSFTSTVIGAGLWLRSVISYSTS